MYSTFDLSYTSVWYGSLLFCVILCKFIEIRNYDKLYTTKLASNFLFNWNDIRIFVEQQEL